MLSVVTAFWDRRRRVYQTYTAETVNVLKRSVARNLTVPHEFVCLTDQPAAGFDADIRLAPLETDLIPLGNAYPKLAIFKREPDLAERILWLDLDTAVTGSLDSIVSRPEPIVLLPEFNVRGRSKTIQASYNTSVILLARGAAPRVWESFDKEKSPRMVRRTGKIGSDQVFVSVTLGPDVPTWPADDQILSFKYHCRFVGLPPRAAIVCFHGAFKPWDAEVQTANPWVKAHWR